MEIRKIQVSGGSSFIVSLPKDWIRTAGIRKNDPVGLIMQADGTLLITPNTDGEHIRKIKNFEVNASTNETYFFRELIGAYIAGYTTLSIKAPGRLPSFVVPRVRDFTGMAIGQEVVDETENSITVRDLLNPSEMPMKSTIKRMSMIVTKMHKDAIIAFRNFDINLAENVMARDNDVDRLHWLIARQTNLIFHDVNLSRKMKVSVENAAHYSHISKIIERVGDHGTRIAKNSRALNGKNIDETLLREIEESAGYAIDIFHKSINSFSNNDLQNANGTITMLSVLEAKCKDISTRSLEYDATIAIHLVSISDSIGRVGDYAADICEHVINSVTGEAIRNTQSYAVR